MKARSKARSSLLYEYIDASAGFYSNKVQAQHRSMINVVCKVKGGIAALEAKFVAEALENGLIGLAGHPSVGGLRFTLNNHMPFEGIYTLIDFMEAFKNRNSQ